MQVAFTVDQIRILEEHLWKILGLGHLGFCQYSGALCFGFDDACHELCTKVKNLNATDDWESSEESHGASDQTKLALKLDLLVPLDLVEGGRVEEDVDKLQRWTRLVFDWQKKSST